MGLWHRAKEVVKRPPRFEVSLGFGEVVLMAEGARYGLSPTDASKLGYALQRYARIASAPGSVKV
jgi:hypothetical protein